LFEATNKVEFKFFHPENAMLSGIESNATIPTGDPIFKEVKNFPVNSAFLAGCIKIQYAN
jgi:hypothetical protein